VPTFENFKTLWVERGFTFYLKNTAIVTVCSVLISVPLATLAAYGLLRRESRLSNSALNFMLGLRMFPQMLLAIPYFLLATKWGLADTKIILILIIVAANQPFAIWLMRGFLVGVPKELDEAANIDGCNMVQIVTRIILPVSMPGISTASIFTFLLSYNEYLFALVLTQKKAMTLPIAIGQYGAEDLSYWTLSASGVISIVIPVCLVMIFLQKWLVKGLTAGAVKG
jgi:multiple sugar transport system permease protein